MKKYLTFSMLLLLLLGFARQSSAQSLSFSEVILVGAVEDTVPAGKVWKVESVLANNDLSIYTGTTSHQTRSTAVLVNGATVYIVSTWGSSYGNGMIETSKLPMWLPAGTRLRASTNVQNISVIEFNVVP